MVGLFFKKTSNKPPENIPLIGAGSGDFDPSYQGFANAIICRTNKGVIESAVAAAKRGVPVSLDNVTDVVREIFAAHRLFKERTEHPAYQGIRDWQQFCEIVDSKDSDHLDFIREFVASHDADVLDQIITSQPNIVPSQSALVLTAHRSKGHEFPICFLGGDWKTISEMTAAYTTSTSSTERAKKLEEFNLLYVALTRATRKVSNFKEILSN